MEAKFNYAVVGLFVIILSLAFFIIVIWLSIGLSSKSYNSYLVLIHESVSGLSVKAPVKYNGVEVGYVQSISLNPKNPSEVRLLLNIERDVLLSLGTYAKLDTQGLTGIAYIELTGGTVGAPLLEAPVGQPYPIIPSEPSLMFRFDAILNHLSSSLDEITGGIKQAFNVENMNNLSETLENIHKISQMMHSDSDQLQSIIRNMGLTFHNTAQASKNLPPLIHDLKSASKKLDEMASDIKQVSVEAKNTFSSSTVMIENVNQQVLPEFSSTLSEFKAVLESFKTLSETLADNPSAMIRGTVPPKPGPGES